MQSYEQACIHVDESPSINELWHATLLQTSTPGGGRGEVGRAGPVEVGGGGLNCDRAKQLVCRQMMWLPLWVPPSTFFQRNLFAHATTLTSLFFAQRKKKKQRWRPAAVCASCARKHPTNSIFKSNARDHYIRLMSLRSDA